MSEVVRDALSRVLDGEELAPAAMEAAMDSILAGEATPAQIAGLAIALRMRGETTAELAAAARAMRRRVAAPDLGTSGVLLDTCGTGGDGAGTFNVSTTCALVVAACGVRVAKHGNRAVSSRSGSADVLEALGIRVDAPHPEVVRHLRELGIAFFFAPAYHAALKHAASARRELGVRTFFNLLGPLVNPARATHQLLGVYDPARLRTVAEVLALLGLEGAWVVHGHGGLDEISPSGATRVARLHAGRVVEEELVPSDFGLDSVPQDGIAGGDATHNALLLRSVLGGERGPRDRHGRRGGYAGDRVPGARRLGESELGLPGDARQRGGARPARGRILRHGPLDDRPDLGRNVGRKRPRCVTYVLHGNFKGVVPLERAASGQALVRDHAQRVDVRGGGGDSAGGLLGRDVRGGAEHRAGGGELADQVRAGDAEVGEHERAVRPDQQVAGLHVAVHDALLVRRVQRVGGLRQQRHRAGRGQPADAAERGGERVALDVLHHQERDVLVAAEVVDVDHAGVVDGGHGPGLAAEPLGEAGFVQQRREQALDRDGTAQHLVGAAPHVAHATAGDPLVEAVAVAELHSRTEHVSASRSRRSPRP